MFDSPSAWKRLLLTLLSLIGLASLIAASYQFAETDDSSAPAANAGPDNNRETALVTSPLSSRLSQTDEEDRAEGSSSQPSLALQPARMVKLQTDLDSRTLWTLKTTLGAFLSEAGVVLDSDHQIIADGILVPLDALDETDLPRQVEIGRYWRVTIDDGLNRQVLRTAAPTIRMALRQAEIVLNAADQTEPSLDTPLTGDTLISLKRSFPLSIHADGMYIQTRTAHTQIEQVLAQAGIQLTELDYTVPDINTVLQPNDLIQVVRVTEGFITEDESIPYHTMWQGTDELPIDSQAIISQGVQGIRRRSIRVRYENGAEVSRGLEAEWVAVEPVNEVIGYGTRIELGVVETPEGPREYWRVVRMRVTSYTAASSGKRAGEPGYGVTASGRSAGYGVIAIDRNVVPFRSHVYVPGYGIGFAGDTGGGIRGRWIDLGYDEENFVSWSGYADVYYLTPVPPLEDINFLLPARLP